VNGKRKLATYARHFLEKSRKPSLKSEEQIVDFYFEFFIILTLKIRIFCVHLRPIHFSQVPIWNFVS